MVNGNDGQRPRGSERFRELLNALENNLAQAPGWHLDFAWQLARLADILCQYADSQNGEAAPLTRESPRLKQTLEVFRAHQDQKIRSIKVIAQEANAATNPAEIRSLIDYATTAVRDVCRLQEKKDLFLRSAAGQSGNDSIPAQHA